MEEKVITGVLRGPAKFWREGAMVGPVNGRVECTRVQLPSVFTSDEVNDDGKPVHTGYVRLFVNADEFVRLTSGKDRSTGRDVEVPVAVAGDAVVTETTTRKVSHTYNVWEIGQADGVRLIAWDELKFVPGRTTVSDDAMVARFTRWRSVGSTGFPEVVPVKRSRFGNGVTSI